MPRRIAALFILSLAASAHAIPAHAGEITRQSADTDFTWISTECVAPVQPFIRPGDPERQQLMMTFATETQLYIDCLKREAQRDFDRAQEAMQDAVQRSLQEEVDALNSAMDAVVVQSR